MLINLEDVKSSKYLFRVNSSYLYIGPHFSKKKAEKSINRGIKNGTEWGSGL